MSLWESERVQGAVVEALQSVRLNNPGGHHFGRPYVTAYQLAMAVDAAHPTIRAKLGVEVGGAGTGAHSSLSQYLARELSNRIKRAQQIGASFPVEGAFVSNEHILELAYRTPEGQRLTSSLTGTGYDLSMFRLA